MCNCNPIIAMSAEAKRLSNILKAMFIGYIALMICMIVIGSYSLIISYLLAMIVVLVTAFQANYQFAGISFFFAFFNCFSSVIYILLRIQNAVLSIKDIFYDNQGMYIAALIIESFAVLFHVALMYYLFKAYCEFKAQFKTTTYRKQLFYYAFRKLTKQ